MTQTIILSSDFNRSQAKSIIDKAPHNAVVKVSEATRTNDQNSTIHMWFGEIARQLGDVDSNEVKGQCHRRWGLSIRLRDPQFAWVWRHSGASLNYEQQCSLLASGVLNVSSGMTVKELSEYMDSMARQYRSQGLTLTDPKPQQYQDAS